MNRFLGISGSESVAAAANVFVGQTNIKKLLQIWNYHIFRIFHRCGIAPWGLITQVTRAEHEEMNDGWEVALEALAELRRHTAPDVLDYGGNH